MATRDYKDIDRDDDALMKKVLEESELFKGGLTIETLMRVSEGLSDLKAANGQPLSIWFIRRKDPGGTITWIFGW